MHRLQIEFRFLHFHIDYRCPIKKKGEHIMSTFQKRMFKISLITHFGNELDSYKSDFLFCVIIFAQLFHGIVHIF